MIDHHARHPIDVGDRITVRHNFGGFLRPTVRRGTTGIVTRRTLDGTLYVAFPNAPTLVLQLRDVTPTAPDSPQTTRTLLYPLRRVAQKALKVHTGGGPGTRPPVRVPGLALPAQALPPA